jgi:hypothetical protein
VGGFVGQVQHLANVARDAWPQIQHIATTVGGALVGAFRVVVPLIGSVVGWFNQHRNVAIALASAVGALVVVTRGARRGDGRRGRRRHHQVHRVDPNRLGPHEGVGGGAVGSQRRADRQPDRHRDRGPGRSRRGVVLAWRNSETFRRVVTAAWNGIKVAAQAVAAWFMAYVLPTLKAVWTGIAAGATWMWNNVIHPVVNALVAYFRNVVAPVFTWLWKNIVSPAFNAIGRVIKAGVAVGQLAVAVIVAYYKNVLAPTFLWLWHNVVSPAFTAISAIVRTQINIVRTIFNGLVSVIRSVIGPAVMWLWHNTIAPAFNGIRALISSAWNVIHPLLTSFGNFIKSTLPSAFRTGVSAITSAWSKVQAAAKAPVTFVVNHVINPLIGGFNKVAKIFGTSQIDPIKGFAAGGRIPGVPSSRDNILGAITNGAGKVLGPVKVATGEFIVNARDTAKALPLLRWINSGMKGRAASAMLGRGLYDMPGDGSEGYAFAGGGLVGFLDDVWGAISNPAKAIKAPIEAALSQIPGSGLIRDVLIGMGRKLISGLTGFLGGTGGGTGGAGNLGRAQAFLHAQNGKPYVWASAGPGGLRLLRHRVGGLQRATRPEPLQPHVQHVERRAVLPEARHRPAHRRMVAPGPAAGQRQRRAHGGHAGGLPVRVVRLPRRAHGRLGAQGHRLRPGRATTTRAGVGRRERSA